MVDLKPELIPIRSRAARLTFFRYTTESVNGENESVRQRDQHWLRLPPGISFHSKAELEKCGFGHPKLCPTKIEKHLSRADLNSIDDFDVGALVSQSARSELHTWLSQTKDERVIQAIEARFSQPKQQD